MAKSFQNCRELCSDDDFPITCLEKCQDQDLVNLVAKHLGEEKAEQCRGFRRGFHQAAYQLDPNFVSKADNKAKKYPEHIRENARDYFRMPVAPYPPGPNKSPEGVRNNTPNYDAMLDYLKANPCFKYQVLAKARELKGAPKVKEGGPSTKFLVGVACLGVAVVYFVRK